MSKRIAILQPGYLPWLGYFEQLARVDLFVHYDDVQYTRRDWRNRNRIKGPEGPTWLTVPVAVKGNYHIPISKVTVPDQLWRDHHLRTIRHCYARCPYFDSVYPKLERWLGAPWTFLADGCIEGINMFCTELGARTETMRSSEVTEVTHLGKSERLIAICQRLGATEYLSGASARAYLDNDAFERAGIRVIFQEYKHPTYGQRWGDFVPYLSVLDLVMNEGPRSLDILLTSGGLLPIEA